MRVSWGDGKEIYRGWKIVVKVGAWHGSASNERFAPTVAVMPPDKIQQRFLDVGGGAAFLLRADALRHGLAVARTFVDLQMRASGGAR
jgi:hypothetical protein